MKIININLSIKFPINKSIRRSANAIEDKLSIAYLPPIILPIPDDIDPALPRLQFQSKSGHSNIIFTQQSIDVTINFDDKYWNNFDSCREYLEKRVIFVYEVLDSMLDIDEFYYTGITLLTRLPFNSHDTEDRDKAFDKYEIDKEFYDFERKTTQLIENTFFKNIQISNYRDYKGDITNPTSPFLVNFSRATLSESGLQYIIDVNDRYQYIKCGNNYKLTVLKERIESNISSVFDELRGIENDNL